MTQDLRAGELRGWQRIRAQLLLGWLNHRSLADTMSSTKPELARLAGRLKRFVHKRNINQQKCLELAVSIEQMFFIKYPKNQLSTSASACTLFYHLLGTRLRLSYASIKLICVLLLYLSAIGTFVIGLKVAAPTCSHFASKARPKKIKLRRLRNKKIGSKWKNLRRQELFILLGTKLNFIQFT